MSGIQALGAAAGGGSAGLAAKLHAVADEAARAATFAEGEYLPQMSRSFELERSFRGAERAVGQLEDLLPGIASLDGGDDGLRLARAAIDNLRAGQQALRDGVSFEDDIVRGGAAVVDVIGTGSASAYFSEASRGVRGIGDLAALESTSIDDLSAAAARLID